jgi:hypothetical protein
VYKEDSMKVNLIKDEKGRVVATFEPPRQGGPMLKPVLKHGQTVLEVEAPENYAADIKTFYAKHSR